jgi:hypothetical protein
LSTPRLAGKKTRDGSAKRPGDVQRDREALRRVRQALVVVALGIVLALAWPVARPREPRCLLHQCLEQCSSTLRASRDVVVGRRI